MAKGETAEFFDFNQIFNQKNQFNQKIDLIKKISLIKEKHLFSALFHRIYRNNHKQWFFWLSRFSDFFDCIDFFDFCFDFFDLKSIDLNQKNRKKNQFNQFNRFNQLNRKNLISAVSPLPIDLNVIIDFNIIILCYLNKLKCASRRVTCVLNIILLVLWAKVCEKTMKNLSFRS